MHVIDGKKTEFLFFFNSLFFGVAQQKALNTTNLRNTLVQSSSDVYIAGLTSWKNLWSGQVHCLLHQNAWSPNKVCRGRCHMILGFDAKSVLFFSWWKKNTKYVKSSCKPRICQVMDLLKTVWPVPLASEVVCMTAANSNAWTIRLEIHVSPSVCQQAECLPRIP